MGIHPDLSRLLVVYPLGASYGQNVLNTVLSCPAGVMAGELGEDDLVNVQVFCMILKWAAIWIERLTRWNRGEILSNGPGWWVNVMAEHVASTIAILVAAADALSRCTVSWKIHPPSERNVIVSQAWLFKLGAVLVRQSDPISHESLVRNRIEAKMNSPEQRKK